MSVDRRSFCKSSAALSAAIVQPMLLACRTPLPESVAGVSPDGVPVEVPGAAVKELSRALTGDLLRPGDARYDSARRIWNSIHDKRPALIVQAGTTRDVVHAIEFARDNHLLLAVKGGGHSWPGKSVCDGGLMLDLGRLNTVVLDRKARVASVGGGALLRQLDAVTLEAGLATTTGVVSHTGIGGYTLGGGYGRLNRKFGLAIDNLLAAEVVTADGKLRRISSYEEPDLFWGIRGGGGNFGVVTRFEFGLHRFDRNVLSGLIRWPLAQAREVLAFYAAWYAGLPNELYVAPSMGTLSDGTTFLACEAVYAGDPAAGEKALEPLRSMGKPLEDTISRQDYMAMQTMADGTFGHGIRSYARNGMVREIHDELIDALIGAFRPDPRLAFFSHAAGGVISRIPESATAYPHRKATLMLAVTGAWTDPEDDELAIEILREWYGAIEPYTGAYYDNIAYDVDNSEGQNFGPNYRRLQQVKATYDPENLFRLNSNILPAGSAPTDAGQA